MTYKDYKSGDIILCKFEDGKLLFYLIDIKRNSHVDSTIIQTKVMLLIDENYLVDTDRNETYKQMLFDWSLYDIEKRWNLISRI